MLALDTPSPLGGLPVSERRPGRLDEARCDVSSACCIAARSSKARIYPCARLSSGVYGCGSCQSSAAAAATF